MPFIVIIIVAVVVVVVLKNMKINYVHNYRKERFKQQNGLLIKKCFQWIPDDAETSDEAKRDCEALFCDYLI